MFCWEVTVGYYYPEKVFPIEKGAGEGNLIVSEKEKSYLDLANLQTRKPANLQNCNPANL